MKDESYILTVKGHLFPSTESVDVEDKLKIAEETHNHLLKFLKKNEVVIAPTEDGLEFIHTGDISEMFYFYKENHGKNLFQIAASRIKKLF